MEATLQNSTEARNYLDLEKKTSSGFYAENLTGVRAFAVLWVLIFHTWGVIGGSIRIEIPFSDQTIGLTRIIKSGEWGVDIFFTLSGFLLTLPWIKNGLKIPTWSETLQFYQRRLLRILPAFYFILLILIYFLQYGLGSLPTAAQMFQHTLFINSWFDTPPLRGAFWSMPVEATFYAFLPLFILIAAKIKSTTKVMLTLIVAGICFRIFVFHSPLIENKGKFLFSFFGRIDQFAIGALFAHLLIKAPPSARSANYLIIISTLMLIVFSGIIDRRGNMFESRDIIYPYHQAIVGLISGLLIYSAAGPGKIARYIFGNRIMIFIGTISYSMYLWHTVIIDIFAKTNITYRAPEGMQLSMTILQTWPLIFIASIISYFSVERYFLNIRHNPSENSSSLTQKYPIISLSLMSVSLVALTILAQIAQQIGK